jgi:outer membrane protein
MKLNFTALIVALGLMGGTVLMAQNPPTQKIGVLDYLGAIVMSAEGKVANEEFQKKLSVRKTELEGKQTALQDLQKQLETKGPLLSEQAQTNLSKQIATNTTDLQRAQEDSEKEFSALRNDILIRIGKKIAPVIEKYARENNFTLVLDSSGQTSQLLYASSAVVITDDIIKAYDAANPAPPAATPAK